MLDGLSLRIENGRLELDDDGGVHGARLFHARRVDLLHRREAAPGYRLLIAAAVGPDRMGDPAEGHEAGVVALLVAVVDGAAGEDAVAVVLVRADVRDAHVRAEARAAVARARQ